jgi:hypothetical protein
MDFALPPSARVDKTIPKNKFSERCIINTKVRRALTDEVKKIIWRYKLSEKTLNTPPAEGVEEIQIFELVLKEKGNPKSIIRLIDRAIPYPVLFLCTYEGHFFFSMGIKTATDTDYFFSDWDEELVFDFSGRNLRQVYEKMGRSFLKNTKANEKDFTEAVENEKQKKSLEREISALKNHVRREKQFNRKVNLNMMLQKKQKELQELTKNEK